MSEKKLKAAVIGTGRIGSQVADDPKANGVQSHAEAYVKSPRTELIAVCDSNPSLSEKAGTRWKVPFFTDPETLIRNAKPEILSICTPDETHAEILRLCLKSSLRGILVEKPLAVHSKDALELSELAKKQGTVLSVNYTRRFVPSFIELKKWLERGSLGTPQLITGAYVKGIKHNGTHWIDLARYLFGEISTVRGWNRRGEVQNTLDPTLDAELGFSSGAKAYLHGLDTGHFTFFEMDIIGSKARVRICDSGNRLEISQAQDSSYFSGFKDLVHTKSPVPEGLKDAALHAVIDLAEAITAKRSPLCTAEDAIRALQVAEHAIMDAMKG